MSEGLQMILNDDGAFEEYDDTYDLTIHCESREEQEEVLNKLNCRWIPVSERLPKAGEYIGDVAKYYLVQNEYGDMMVAHYAHSEYWEQMHQLGPIADDVVAWMPLPKPYVPDTNVGGMKA